MSAKLLGAHVPIAGGLGKAIRLAKSIGCDSVQVFTSSPQMWKAKPVTDEAVEDFRKALTETGIEKVISHDSYLINLCSLDEELKQKSFEGLKAEIGRCAQYGIPYVVSHMGGSKGQTEEEGLLGIAEATLRILEQTPETVTLLMETTAGQGSSLNYRFEHLAQILKQVNHPRLGVCLDTCHVFAAGYDIRTEETYDLTFRLFDSVIGLQHLKVIHCNDSKKPLGSRVDRHDNIGEGLIGPTPFRQLVNDPRFENIPIVLETPDAPEGHARNLATLRSYFK